LKARTVALRKLVKTTSPCFLHALGIMCDF
jgi:hypothetical protein